MNTVVIATKFNTQVVVVVVDSIYRVFMTISRWRNIELEVLSAKSGQIEKGRKRNTKEAGGRIDIIVVVEVGIKKISHQNILDSRRGVKRNSRRRRRK